MFFLAIAGPMIITVASVQESEFAFHSRILAARSYTEQRELL